MSQPVLVWTAQLKDGRVTFDRPSDVAGYCRGLGNCAVEVVIRRRRVQRSLDQNAYWWAVPVRLCAESLGYSDVEMHYALLGECFGWHCRKVGGRRRYLPNVGSSSGLTVEQFTKLIEWVLVWGPEQGIRIPAPNECEVAA